MPNAPVPAAATGLPTPRRGFLRGLTALPLIGAAGAALACTGMPGESHPDAAILALEPVFLRREAELEAARDASRRAEARVTRRIGRRPKELMSAASTAWAERAKPLRSEFGVYAAEKAIDAAWHRAYAVIEQMQAIRPRTLDGLCAQVRVMQRFALDPENDIFDDILAVHAAMNAGRPA